MAKEISYGVRSREFLISAFLEEPEAKGTRDSVPQVSQPPSRVVVPFPNHFAQGTRWGRDGTSSGPLPCRPSKGWSHDAGSRSVWCSCCSQGRSAHPPAEDEYEGNQSVVDGRSGGTSATTKYALGKCKHRRLTSVAAGWACECFFLFSFSPAPLSSQKDG